MIRLRSLKTTDGMYFSVRSHVHSILSFPINYSVIKKATNRVLHLLFIDLTKAYYSVPLNKLWEVLEKSLINTRLIETIKLL